MNEAIKSNNKVVVEAILKRGVVDVNFEKVLIIVIEKKNYILRQYFFFYLKLTISNNFPLFFFCIRMEKDGVV